MAHIESIMYMKIITVCFMLSTYIEHCMATGDIENNFQVEYPSLWRTFHCLAQTINATSASVMCGKDPTREDIQQALYYGLCRPQDVKYVKINCLFNKYATVGEEGLGDPYFLNDFEPQCWCGTVYFTADKLSSDGQGEFDIFPDDECNVEISGQNIRWMYNLLSLRLLSIPVFNINYGLLNKVSSLFILNTGVPE